MWSWNYLDAATFIVSCATFGLLLGYMRGRAGKR